MKNVGCRLAVSSSEYAYEKKNAVQNCDLSCSSHGVKNDPGSEDIAIVIKRNAQDLEMVVPTLSNS